jgi:hypothetical protein
MREAVDGPTAGGRAAAFLSVARPSNQRRHVAMAVTKAQEIYDKVETLVGSGMEKADAFRQVAGETSRPFDSVRGSYYSHKKKIEGGSETRPSRTRRRETTPEDALADARAALERAIEAIDREVEAAKGRATEAAAEYEALRGSAKGRKEAITERLDALR